MRYLDFEYDDSLLSDFGFIICDFNSNNNANTVDSGSEISFIKSSRNDGRKFSIVGTKYEECINAEFDICKDPDVNSPEEMQITDYEYSNIMRWLNRHEYKKMQFIGNDERISFYNASFNLKKITINDKLYGMHLSMDTDSPFSYGEEIVKIVDISSSEEKKIIEDESDEIGYIYPTVEITCNESGNLVLKNETFGSTTTVHNCTSGEVITLHGDIQQITSSLNSHKISKDFNYEFFRIENSYRERKNEISSSLACSVKISYFPLYNTTP